MIKYLLLLLISLPLMAQNDFKLDFDFAQFRYDSTSNYVEIYYSFNQADLTLINEDGNFIVKALMHIQIQNIETDELIVNKDWTLKQNVAAEKNNEKNQSLLGVLGFNIKSGTYRLSISVEDEVDKNIRREYTENVSIIPFYRDNFVISDIELATRIINENSNEQSIFYKNTLEVFPNPSIIYTNNSPILFYYTELYGLNIKETGSKLELNREVFNSHNEKIFEKKKLISRNMESVVDVGFVNLKKYPTGSYTLNLKLTDLISNKIASTSKKFYLINPGIIDSGNTNRIAGGFMSSEFGVYLEEECDDLFFKSRILALPNELKEYDRLSTLDSKRSFLYTFWKKRDTIPETETNEFKKMYLERIEIVNEKFRTIANVGYKTDRGRVYLKLGKPDEVDRYPYETETKPYEIWSYNQIEGGVMFVFADLTGYNYYELLHSTKRGELQDPNWQRRIQTN
jgi:GWxTD domain-containing protein